MNALLLTMAVAVAAPTSMSTPPSTPPSSPPPAVNTAISLEEEAFSAIDQEQWCLAMHLFVQADAAAPALPLLENARNAAEVAKDLVATRDLTARLIERETDAREKRRRQSKLKALDATIKKSGGGTPCPSLETLRPPPPPAATPAPAPAPVVDEEASSATMSSSGAPLPATVSYGLLGTGALLAGGGAAVAVVGALPWFAHASALSAINDAEADKADATALQQTQAEARAGWEGYGQLSVVVGSAVAGVGVVALAAGGALLATGISGGSDASE